MVSSFYYLDRHDIEPFSHRLLKREDNLYSSLKYKHHLRFYSYFLHQDKLYHNLKYLQDLKI